LNPLERFLDQNSIRLFSHMFQNSKVNSNKNAHNFWHYFISPVFLAFSDGVIHFVPSVSPRDHFLNIENSPTANQTRSFYLCSFMANTLNKMAHSMWKSLKTVSEMVPLIVYFLRPLVPLERCGVKKRKQNLFPQAGWKLTRRSCTQSGYVCL